MRNISLGFISLITIHFSFGQQKIRKNELSISPIEISNSWFSYNMGNRNIAADLGLNFIYKHQIKAGMYFRVSEKYNHYQIQDIFQDCTDGSGAIEKIDSKILNSSFGFESRRLITKKSYIHYGCDLTTFLLQTKTNYEPVNTRRFGVKQTYGAGFQPFVGLSYYPSKQIFISLESSLFVSYLKEKEKSLDANGLTIPNHYFPNYSGFHYVVSPIRSASIGWVF